MKTPDFYIILSNNGKLSAQLAPRIECLSWHYFGTVTAPDLVLPEIMHYVESLDDGALIAAHEITPDAWGYDTHQYVIQCKEAYSGACLSYFAFAGWFGFWSNRAESGDYE